MRRVAVAAREAPRHAGAARWTARRRARPRGTPARRGGSARRRAAPRRRAAREALRHTGGTPRRRARRRGTPRRGVAALARPGGPPRGRPAPLRCYSRPRERRSWISLRRRNEPAFASFSSALRRSRRSALAVASSDAQLGGVAAGGVERGAQLDRVGAGRVDRAAAEVELGAQLRLVGARGVERVAELGDLVLGVLGLLGHEHRVAAGLPARGKGGAQLLGGDVRLGAVIRLAHAGRVRGRPAASFTV